MRTTITLGLCLLPFACAGQHHDTGANAGSGGSNVGASALAGQGGAGQGRSESGVAGSPAGGTTVDGTSGAPSGAGGTVNGGTAGSVAWAGAVAGAAGLSGCELQRVTIERAMTAALDAAAAGEQITETPDFTLALETNDGYRFVYSHGDSSLQKVYESASTSKWVTAAVILDLVDQGLLSLADEPSKYLAFWKTTGVNLAHLLSFTSGFSEEVLCFNLPNYDFAQCVENAYNANVGVAPPPGTAFRYSSTHMQIAGLMAIVATHAAGWAPIFSAWQARTGLFPTGAFDLPSLQNPRLAGGMHWTGAEYMQFLRAIVSRGLLREPTLRAMLDNQRGAAHVVSSPTIDAFNRDWAYGFGNWLECPDAVGPDSFNCGSGHRNSSPGAYGAYPFVDFDHGYFGLLARQGKLGTFRDGDALFQVVAADSVRWADACK